MLNIVLYLSRKRLLLFIVVDAIIKCIIVCLTMQSLEMQIAMFRLLTVSLLQAIRSTDCMVSLISQRLAVIGAFRSYCSIVLVSSCSLSGLLLYHSPVVVFFDRGHSCFRNFNSTIPVDVIRMESYVNSFLDPTCVPVRISINKLEIGRAHV